MKNAFNRLAKAKPGATVAAGRTGTAYATLDVLKRALGDPSFSSRSPRYYADGDRFTIGWMLETPRGYALLRDWWANGPEEWSLSAASPRAALWLAGYLRSLGICASTRLMPPARDPFRTLVNLT